MIALLDALLGGSPVPFWFRAGSMSRSGSVGRRGLARRSVSVGRNGVEWCNSVGGDGTGYFAMCSGSMGRCILTLRSVSMSRTTFNLSRVGRS
jgi:hypothetical protein